MFLMVEGNQVSAWRFSHNQNRPYKGIVIDSAWIDRSRIRAWLNFCDLSHGGKCHHLPEHQRIRPCRNLHLIDVQRGCLVQLPGTTKYFALSYVWGQLQNILQTQKGTLEHMEREASISTETPNLPEPVRDAMRLLHGLGERYLWVDRLCIIQDDDENKNFHISNMDSIYFNAYCTIVAADGRDAKSGLPGVGLGSQPRNFHQQFVRFTKSTLQSDKGRLTRVGPHASRAWTFQEMFLSRRCIIFSNNTVYWNCQQSLWREDICGDPEGGLGFPNAHHYTMGFKAWPDTNQWASLVGEYCRRDMTYQEDAHAAFTGIEKVLERTFPAGFLYGLPEFFFDYAILWNPGRVLKRRMVPSGHEDVCYKFPSWSWLGWEGPNLLNFQSAGSGFATDRDPNSLFYSPTEVNNLVEWFQLGPTGQRRVVRNDYHKWRSAAREESVTPEGWTVHTDKRERYHTKELAPGVFFAFPMPEVFEYGSEPNSKQFPVLQFRSSRAFFSIAESIVNFYQSNMAVLLVDEKRHWAGYLALNRAHNEEVPVGQICELIAISTGRSRRCESGGWSAGFHEMRSPQCPQFDEMYEFYNVLWIKWEGEYAVREALGRVEKSVWEKQDLEEIDVKLN